jgi:hypothetical protein
MLNSIYSSIWVNKALTVLSFPDGQESRAFQLTEDLGPWKDNSYNALRYDYLRYRYYLLLKSSRKLEKELGQDLTTLYNLGPLAGGTNPMELYEPEFTVRREQARQIIELMRKLKEDIDQFKVNPDHRSDNPVSDYELFLPDLKLNFLRKDKRVYKFKSYAILDLYSLKAKGTFDQTINSCLDLPASLGARLETEVIEINEDVNDDPRETDFMNWIQNQIQS